LTKAHIEEKNKGIDSKFILYPFIDVYDQEISNEFSLEIAQAYRNMAGLGYITKESALSQFIELKKINDRDTSKISYLIGYLFEILDWEYIGTETLKEEFEFSFTVIRNLKKGKLIVAIKGTNPESSQIFVEGLENWGEAYFREPKSNIIIMRYFHKLYQRIQNTLLEYIQKASDPSIKQIIFVGHSLGGAMSSIAALDLVRSGVIKKTSISPVLITYGQPRTGNYAFANEVFKNVPVILRYTNQKDIVPTIPTCVKTIPVIGLCRNEFGKSDLDAELNEYTPRPYSYNFYKFFPWHIRGQFTILDDNITIKEECTNKCENENKCSIINMDIRLSYHSNYFGNKISDFPKPEIMPYSSKYFRGLDIIEG
jgi:hypothetical protein